VAELGCEEAYQEAQLGFGPMNQRTYIIAEAGVNHNGSLGMAKKLVAEAARAGADAVKIHTCMPERVISKFAAKAEYQKKTTGADESQLEMVRKLHLDESAHREIQSYCSELRIEFLSSPFDLESIDFLARGLGLKRLKLPSGEITNGPYLLKAARTGVELILSTGMSMLEEIEAALGVLAFGLLGASGKPSHVVFREAYRSEEGRRALKAKVSLLHCTTEYPAPFEDVNINAMETMRKSFGLPVGYSDHTVGIAVPIAAVAKGAVIIEKHFTLDRALPGPDHMASLEPAELAEMVRSIREVEKALGCGGKAVAASEEKNKPIVRKSLVAAQAIRQGEVFSESNITAKRPGTGISPMHYWEWIGRVATREFREDEEIG
jgi:N-acetylneuraminate synthase